MSQRDVVPLRCRNCNLVSPDRVRSCPMRAAQYEAGKSLAREGEVPAQIVYLRRGHVVLSGGGAAGRNRSCAVRGAGTLLGVDAVLDRPLPYDVRALTDVAVCAADPAVFGRWLGPLDSPLGVAFSLTVTEAARRASERHALEGTALRRVARFLLQTTDGDASPAPEIPHSVLANVLGLRAETLSRALAALRASRALGPGRRICVVDRDALLRAADEPRCGTPAARSSIFLPAEDSHSPCHAQKTKRPES